MGLDDFDVIQSLGKGAFARVDKVKRKVDGKIYALKRVNISTIPPKDLEDSLNEIRILASFKHPRLIRWYETFVESDLQELCIVMELCPYGDLEQKIKRHQHRKQYIDEREIWVYSVNLLEGLAALHAKGVCHRDLKPANCLIDQHGCVKIADMNISKVSKGGDGGMMQTQVGTPYFICPEIYLKRPYSSTSDMWSLGGVLYNLAALHPPFLADNIQNLRKVVVRGTYDPLPSVYGGSLTALIGRLLQVNPSDRPEAKDILKDPLVERHKYLLLHPLPVGAEDAEGEMLPTIRVASDKEGTKTITLPGPAYEEEGAKEGGEVVSPKASPRSPTSVFVVYSPRAKEGSTTTTSSSSSASSSSRSSSSSNNNNNSSSGNSSSSGSSSNSSSGNGSGGNGMKSDLHPLQRPAQPRTSLVPAFSSPFSSSPSSLPPPSLLHPAPLSRPPPSLAIPSFPNSSSSSSSSSSSNKGISSPSTQQQKQTTPAAPTAAPGSPPRTTSPLSSLLPALQDMGRDMARHLPSRSSPSPKELQQQQLEKEKARQAAADFGGGANFIDTGDNNYEEFPEPAVVTAAAAAATTVAAGPPEGKPKRSSIRKVFEGEMPAFPTAEMKNFFSGGKLPMLPGKGRATTPPTTTVMDGGK